MKRRLLATRWLLCVLASGLFASDLLAQIDFTFTPIGPTPASNVSFHTDSGAVGTWNFGDGQSSTSLPDVDHGYSAGIFRANLTIGSNSIDKDVGVIPSSDPQNPPTPDFTFSPPNPIVGQNVTFTDTSTGAIGHWIWDFGNGQKSYITSKGLSHAPLNPGSPATVYLTTGTFTVSLELQNNTTGTVGPKKTVQITVGSPATPTFTPTPTPTPTDTPSGPTPTFTPTPTPTITPTPTVTPTPTSPPVTTSSVVVPVAAHVVGKGGTLFLTDIEIENTTGAAAAATLSFYPVGSGTPSLAPLTLNPRETRAIRDVVATIFGVTNSFGALRLDASGSPAPLLLMKSRTYDEGAAGSFGLSIPGAKNPAPDPTSSFVTGIQQNESFRTNIGAFNTGGSSETFQVVLHGGSGAIAGTTAPMTLGPGVQWQAGIGDLFPGTTGTGMTAEFQGVAGSAVPVAYGILADNLSQDLTYYPALRPDTTFYLPVISRITGFNNSLFKSELDVFNASLGFELVTLTFFERDRDNTSGARVASFTLSPGETRLIDDAVATLLGLSETFGAVRITSTGPFVAGARIYTNSPTTAGTVGQQVDPIPSGRFYRQGSIVGVRQDAAFRSNVGLVNPNVTAVTAGLTLFRADGSALSSASVPLQPQSMTQGSLANLFPGVSIPAGERLTIHVNTGNGGAVAVYGIIADNVSQDLTTAPGLPLGNTSSPLGSWIALMLAGGVIAAFSVRRR